MREVHAANQLLEGRLRSKAIEFGIDLYIIEKKGSAPPGHRIRVTPLILPSSPCHLGKKVRRREDLLNIEVSGLGRIRQRDAGMGFSLLI